jgi:hypothetical protein
VCKIALRGPAACATARRDFAHAVGREPRGCTPYTALAMMRCALFGSSCRSLIKKSPE